MATLVIIELSKTRLNQISEIAIQAAIMPDELAWLPASGFNSLEYRQVSFPALITSADQKELLFAS